MSFVLNVLQKTECVLGGLTDWLIKHEAQNRGVMHGHAIGYSPDAPQFELHDESSHHAVVKYIDQHVTCDA